MKDVEKTIERATLRANAWLSQTHPLLPATLVAAAIRATLEALAEAEAEERQAIRAAAKPMSYVLETTPFDAAPATPQLPPTPDSYYNGKPR